MTALLELDRVASGYGRTKVLHDVSLTVGAGEIVALIGANGAGKSTLFNTVMGLLPVSSGDIRFDGRSIARLPTPAIVRAGLGQVPERRQLFGTMTVEENLRMGAYAVADRVAVAASLDEQFPLPDPARAAAPGGADAVGRRAADGGDRARHDGAAASHVARRAVARPRAVDGRADHGADRGAARRRQHHPFGRAERARRARHRRSRLCAGEGPHRARRPGRGTAREPAVQDAYLGGQGDRAALEPRIRAKRRAILGR